MKAIYPTDANNLENLIAQADANMYHVKMYGKQDPPKHRINRE